MASGRDELGRLADGDESLDSRLLARVDAAYDCAFARVDAAVAALPDGAPFADRLRALLGALVGATAAERDLARLCLVEAPGLGAGALARKDAAIGRLAGTIARELEAADLAIPKLATEMVAGGVHEVLQRRLATGSAPDAGELAEELTALWLPVLTGRSHD